jgi:hypothetical protein
MARKNAVQVFRYFVGYAGLGTGFALSCGAGINPRKTKIKRKTKSNEHPIS